MNLASKEKVLEEIAFAFYDRLTSIMTDTQYHTD